MHQRVLPFVLAWSLVAACGGTSFSGAGDGGIGVDQACADVQHQRCMKLQACAPLLVLLRYGDEATCEAREKQSCVDALSAPSTGTSPATSEACAQAYPGWSCQDYLNETGTPAACQQQKGSLSDGAACAFPGQCQSGFCAIAPGAACGTCAEPPKAGDACAMLTTCGQGLYCTADTYTCVTFAAQDAPCGKGAPCGAGLSCVGADASKNQQGTCQPAVAMAGAPCDPQQKTGPGCDRNEAGLTCNGQSKQCAAITVNGGGGACGDVDNQTALCSAGGICSGSGAGMAGTCMAAAADGAACDINLGPGCVQPARCVVTGSGTAGTCQLATASACM